jgi:O-antigen/teichoic acid export membrane protein
MSKVVDSSLRTAVKGTTLVFLGTMVSSLLWFATKVLIVREITTEELGVYSLAVAIAGIAAMLADAGLQEGSTRFISIFLGEGRKGDARAVARSSIHLGLIFGLFSSLLLYAFSEPLSFHVFYKPELTGPMKAVSLFSFFTVLAGVMVGIIRGHGEIKQKVYFIHIGQPLFFLAFLSAIFIMGLPFIGIIYAYVMAIACSCLSIAAYGWWKVHFNPLALSGGKSKGELLRFSVPLLGVAVMGLVFTWTDTLMLGRYESAADLGIYSVSVSLARLLTFVLGAAGFVFMPIVGEMYSKRQSYEMKRSYQVLTKWVFSATLPAFFVLFFFPETTIRFLFGEGFVESSNPLRILALGYMFHVFLGTNGMLLMVLGYSKRLMQISVFGALLNIALNYVMIKRLGYGIMGAAAATSVSYIAVIVVNSVVLYWHSKVQPFTPRYLKPLAGLAVIGVVLYTCAKTLPFYLWMLPLYLILFIGGYLFSLLVTRSLDREDIEMFEAVSKKTGIEMKLIRRVLHRFAHE